MSDLPLSGMRVLELGHTVMGQSSSRVLAEEAGYTGDEIEDLIEQGIVIAK